LSFLYILLFFVGKNLYFLCVCLRAFIYSCICFERLALSLQLLLLSFIAICISLFRAKVIQIGQINCLVEEEALSKGGPQKLSTSGDLINRHDVSPCI